MQAQHYQQQPPRAGGHSRFNHRNYDNMSPKNDFSSNMNYI